jgi:hypothetical protein
MESVGTPVTVRVLSKLPSAARAEVVGRIRERARRMRRFMVAPWRRHVAMEAFGLLAPVSG